jgi:hypothetical protein
MREIVADMMADVGGIRPGDPLDLKGHGGSLELQKARNATASEAQGRLAEATAALAGMPEAPTAPDPKRVAKAVEYLGTLKIWAAYSAEVKQSEALVAASAQGAAAVDRWDAAIADLGDCPPDPGAADESQVDLATRKHAAAVDQRYAVSGKIEAVRLEGKAAVSAHRAEMRKAAEALAAHKATQPAVECGTCGQSLPSAEAAAEHHTARTAELGTAYNEWIAKPEPKPADVSDLEAELVKLEGKVEKAKAGIQKARKVVDAHKAEAAAAAEWRRARARIGDRPQSVTIPDAPSKPAGTAPPAQHEDTARALIAASKTHQRDLAAWEKRKARQRIGSMPSPSKRLRPRPRRRGSSSCARRSGWLPVSRRLAMLMCWPLLSVGPGSPSCGPKRAQEAQRSRSTSTGGPGSARPMAGRSWPTSRSGSCCGVSRRAATSASRSGTLASPSSSTGRKRGRVAGPPLVPWAVLCGGW